MPEIIGITGGIGSGKSQVSQYLAKLGSWPLLDVDQICRQLLMPQAPGWLALQKLLTADFFTAIGELDRKRLREAIFTDANLRGEVDALLHPLAKQEMVAQATRLAAPLVLAEIPLLFEAGWQDSVSQIVVVYADEAVCLRRIMERDQVSEEQARQAIAAQMPLEDKAQLADHYVDNSGDWASTCDQLQALAEHSRLQTQFFSTGGKTA